MLVIDGKTIEISAEFEKYNLLRKVYQELAEQLSKDFFDNSTATFGDMDQLFLRFKPIAFGYMERAVDISIRELIRLGINDISDEVFIERYVQKHSQLNDDCLEVFDSHMKIVLDIEGYEEYKKTRSSGGGSVIGGGFGVEGAIKGAAIASAANLAIGAVGGILNSIADGIKEFNNQREKDRLFKSKDTRDSLRRAVFNLVFCVHYGLVDAVDDNVEDKFYEKVSDESAQKSRSLFINITKGRIAENEVRNVLIDAIKLNPYSADLYEYWFENYGDEGSCLLKVEQYFGVVNSSRNAFEDNLTLDIELAIDVVGDSSPEAKPAPENITNSEKTDEHLCRSDSYVSAEKVDQERYEYVKSHIKSGKSIGKDAELRKIVSQDELVKNHNTTLRFLLILPLICMLIITWWHGLLFIVVILLLDKKFDRIPHKNALKRWVADYEKKYGSVA